MTKLPISQVPDEVKRTQNPVSPEGKMASCGLWSILKREGQTRIRIFNPSLGKLVFFVDENKDSEIRLPELIYQICYLLAMLPEQFILNYLLGLVCKMEVEASISQVLQKLSELINIESLQQCPTQSKPSKQSGYQLFITKQWGTTEDI